MKLHILKEKNFWKQLDKGANLKPIKRSRM